MPDELLKLFYGDESDPFDRMLIMQAKRHELVLITNDSKIFAYPVITLEA